MGVRRTAVTAALFCVHAAWYGVAVGPTAAAQELPAADSLILRRMADAHIPGLAAAYVDSGRVAWVGTYGLADVAAGTPVTDSTPFQIASVSKIVTATVLMTLHAEGRFGLDDDVNRYLPFQVRNPSHPTVPITFRQLLNHRSSIADDPAFYGPYWSQSNGDNLTPLAIYLRSYLTAEGKDYSAANFLEAAPGDTTVYCNTCYALIGYLAEVISGVPYAILSDSLLFRPLGMRETHWFARDFTTNGPATPHRFAVDTGFVAYGQNGYPDWPAGTLRTSIRDLSRFLTMYIGGGVIDGRSIIPRSVVDTMAPTDERAAILTWFPRGTSSGEVLLSHGGGDNGVRTFMGFSRSGHRGLIVLTNGDEPDRGLVGELYTLLVRARRARR